MSLAILRIRCRPDLRWFSSKAIVSGIVFSSASSSPVFCNHMPRVSCFREKLVRYADKLQKYCRYNKGHDQGPRFGRVLAHGTSEYRLMV
jgi:hypothetical protein